MMDFGHTNCFKDHIGTALMWTILQHGRKTKVDPMARVEFEMIYRLRVRGPMDARLARRRAPLLGDERRDA